MPAKSRKSTAPIDVTLTHVKDTKGTYVFGNDTEGVAVPQLYVKKSAFPNGAPDSITLTLTVNS